MFHKGHIRLLKRASKLGKIYVGLSTDRFNYIKDKKSLMDYENRKAILESCKYVYKVFPEKYWKQKENDIKKYKIDLFLMGDDWKGKFDYLPCKVIYLKRTKGISTTQLKERL